MRNVRPIFLNRIGDKEGYLIPIENNKNIPFAIKRVYYIWNVPKGEERGFHSHKKLEQLLICIHGSVKVKVVTFSEEEEYLLDSPDKGLYIGPMVWREMMDFSEESVLLVMASELYTEEDYIRNKKQHLNLAKKYFCKEE